MTDTTPVTPDHAALESLHFLCPVCEEHNIEVEEIDQDDTGSWGPAPQCEHAHCDGCGAFVHLGAVRFYPVKV